MPFQIKFKNIMEIKLDSIFATSEQAQPGEMVYIKKKINCSYLG